MPKPDYKAMDAAVKAFLAAYRDMDHDAADTDRLAYEAYDSLGSAEYDVLRQLVLKGPVWDGDVCSKSARDQFLTWGLAVRCVYKGEQGHTAATYPAATLWRVATKKKAEELTKRTLDRLGGTDAAD